MLRGVIVKLAADRQLALDESVVGYLVDPYRALVRRGARRGHRARQGSAAPGPAAEPGAGRRNVPRHGVALPPRARAKRLEFDHIHCHCPSMSPMPGLTERPPRRLISVSSIHRIVTKGGEHSARGAPDCHGRSRPSHCRCTRIWDRAAAGRALRSPEPVARQPVSDLASSPDRFINRELSWLNFNRRVLEESANPQPSAARAAEVSVDFGQQPRRILHGARRRPRRQVREGISTRSPDGLTPAEQLVRIAEAVSRPGRRSAGAVARAARRRWPRPASCWSTARRHQGREGLARGLFSRPRLSAADAARDRSGASVPVHSQSRLYHRACSWRAPRTARR